MKIAFIGEHKCSISNMLAIALTMYSENKNSILLVDADYRKTDLEDALCNEQNLFIKEEAYFGIREGMDYFLYRMKNGEYNPLFTREGVTYITPKLAFIKTAVKGVKSDYEQQFQKYIKALLTEWDKEFDIVMIKCSNLSYIYTMEVVNNCDAHVACFDYRQLINSKERLYDLNRKKMFYILVGQVIGNSDTEKHFLTNICRIDEDNFSLIPYNHYFDMKINTGRLLWLFENGTKNKLSIMEFLDQMKIILHKFRKWLEEIEYYG